MNIINLIKIGTAIAATAIIITSYLMYGSFDNPVAQAAEKIIEEEIKPVPDRNKNE